jgi:hypothetical protein
VAAHLNEKELLQDCIEAAIRKPAYVDLIQPDKPEKFTELPLYLIHRKSADADQAFAIKNPPMQRAVGSSLNVVIGSPGILGEHSE